MLNLSLFPCSRQAPSSFRELSRLACKCQNACAPGLPPRSRRRLVVVCRRLSVRSVPSRAPCLSLYHVSCVPLLQQFASSTLVPPACSPNCHRYRTHMHTSRLTSLRLSMLPLWHHYGWRDSVPHRSASVILRDCAVRPVQGQCRKAEPGPSTQRSGYFGPMPRLSASGGPPTTVWQSHTHLSNTITTLTRRRRHPPPGTPVA